LIDSIKSRWIIINSPFLFWIIASTLLMVFEDLTSTVTVFLLKVLMKICIPPHKQRTKWGGFILML
jgi:hypothetical protein